MKPMPKENRPLDDGRGAANNRTEKYQTAQQYYPEARKASAFAPDVGDKFEWQEGQRRELPKVAGLHFRWPKAFKEQKDYFETWHALVMKVIANNRASFRTIAVLWRFINYQSGTMWPTDSLLARVTGSSERSVSRDIKQYEALGVLRVEHGWQRQRGSGKLVRTRTLIPTVPINLADRIDLPVIDDDTDNSGRDGEGREPQIHTDHCCPRHTDSSGLFTLEEPMKGSEFDEAAT